MRKKKIGWLCLLLAAVLAISGTVTQTVVHNRVIHYTPDYAMIDLTPILAHETFSEDDYRTLFYQTGLGPAAIDELRLREDFAAELTAFQKNFFAPVTVDCRRMAITTCMEFTVDEDGDEISAFRTAPTHTGDVAAMLSSHSFGWRHGHAGLLVSETQVLEAAMIGTDSAVYPLTMWTGHPTFILLRYKKPTKIRSPRYRITRAKSWRTSHTVFLRVCSAIMRTVSPPRPSAPTSFGMPII